MGNFQRAFNILTGSAISSVFALGKVIKTDEEASTKALATAQNAINAKGKVAKARQDRVEKIKKIEGGKK